MFNRSDYEPPCCSNTEAQQSRNDRQCEMESDDTGTKRGLVEMTLKHGTLHSAPVKCLKKAFSTPSQPAGESLTPDCSRSYLPPQYIPSWLLSVSHLSSAATPRRGVRLNICLLSSSIMHRIMADGPHLILFHSTSIRM